MVERESARFEIRQGNVDETLLFLDHLSVIVRIEGGQASSPTLASSPDRTLRRQARPAS